MSATTKDLLACLIAVLMDKGIIQKDRVPAEKLPVGPTGYIDQTEKYKPGTWGYDIYGRLVLVCPTLTRCMTSANDEIKRSREPEENWPMKYNFVGTIFQRYSDNKKIATFGGDWPIDGILEEKEYNQIKTLLLKKVPFEMNGKIIDLA